MESTVLKGGRFLVIRDIQVETMWLGGWLLRGAFGVLSYCEIYYRIQSSNKKST